MEHRPRWLKTTMEKSQNQTSAFRPSLDHVLICSSCRDLDLQHPESPWRKVCLFFLAVPSASCTNPYVSQHIHISCPSPVEYFSSVFKFFITTSMDGIAKRGYQATASQPPHQHGAGLRFRHKYHQTLFSSSACHSVCTRRLNGLIWGIVNEEQRALDEEVFLQDQSISWLCCHLEPDVLEVWS